jgi:hypothetical protein
VRLEVTVHIFRIYLSSELTDSGQLQSDN